MLLNFFSVGSVVLGVQPTLRSSLFPCETPLKDKLSFASGYALKMASGFGVGACVVFSFQRYDLIGAHP
jgi:hypothetical protein